MSKCSNGSNLDCQLKNLFQSSTTRAAVVLHFDSFQHFCHENNVPAAIWIVRAAALLVGLLPSDIVCMLAQSVHLIHAWPIKCRLKWKLTIMPASKLHWLKLINQAYNYYSERDLSALRWFQKEEATAAAPNFVVNKLATAAEPKCPPFMTNYMKLFLFSTQGDVLLSFQPFQNTVAFMGLLMDAAVAC